MKVVLSGMRPTGRMHVGHLKGVLENWVKLQENYKCYFEVADWHALTDEPTRNREVLRNTLDMVKDWLAVGIDPKRSVIFRQSLVPQHAEIHLIFSMLVSVNRLLRNPTFKEKVSELRKKKSEIKLSLNLENLSVEGEVGGIVEFIKREDKEKGEKFLRGVIGRIKEEVLERLSFLDFDESLVPSEISYGFLGYPVLQAADILIYKGELVPVGEDQLPHLELSREIARDFNRIYGEVFPIPEPLLTEIPKILGIDGRKMSKSYNNAIFISDTPEEITQKVKKSITDPMKIRKGDPGRPEICPIFYLHKAFNPDESYEIEENCRKGVLGCVDCKNRIAGKLISALEPYREKAKELSDDLIMDVIREGSRVARERAEETVEEVRRVLWSGS
ncbi:MAG: tryptophan--tRNA ligase [Candidatus Caldipriscus sp.]|nr:tryptophan--tRNA ligase [Candidatus Caldipriscus sp.]